MSIRSLVVSRVAEHLTGESRLKSKRKAAEIARRKADAEHVVEYFHQTDDPYSHLTAQVLKKFQDRYNISLRPNLVSPPSDEAAPEREAMIEFSRSDARQLAHRAGLLFDDPGHQPTLANTANAEAALAASLGKDQFLQTVVEVGQALWSGKTLPGVSRVEVSTVIEQSDRKRGQLGHYLGATFHYGGEWYWGLDRLHLLEERLTALGLRRSNESDVPIYAPPEPNPSKSRNVDGQELELFISFRSPYSYLFFDRATAWAKSRNVTLNIRPVLPMVMRGLPVPKAKKTYILHDVAREARRLNIPFGRICDPLGKPVERGYALLSYARNEGRMEEYCSAFMRGVWSQGLDAGSDRGLAKITKNAGLDWHSARDHLMDHTWREEVEQNRQVLITLGLWGVPSFRFGSLSTWGQDRLWLLDNAVS